MTVKKNNVQKRTVCITYVLANGKLRIMAGRSKLDAKSFDWWEKMIQAMAIS